MQKNKKLLTKFDDLINSKRFGQNYVFTALAVLFSTTSLWSLLSAKLQQSNADQLIYPSLLQNSASFHGAVFPEAHSFLIKWPLFWLINLFGHSPNVFTSFTIASVLLTVGILIGIIYKYEKRPLVFGTMCLALASVLLLIPGQAYAGGLIPVNMAMLAARNLEYLVYIGGLALIIRNQNLRQWKFWCGVLLLGLLIASDHLFLVLGIGGALIALIVYALRGSWDNVSLSVKLLLGSGLAAVSSALVLWLINLSKLTNVAGSYNAYGLAHGSKNLLLGFGYGIAGIFTNFGANPAYDSTIVRDIPHQLYARLSSISGLSYVVNALILFAGLYIAWRIVAGSLVIKKNKNSKPDPKFQLPLALIWSSAAALVVFVISDHYYAVNARYLSIILFAVFISAATYSDQRYWHSRKIIIAGALIVLSIALGIVSTARTYQSDNSALADVNERNSQVAQALKNHPVSTLVGDYWRVLPTKLASGDKINVLPLANCTQARDVLNSSAWQPNLNKHSFAYLLTLRGSLTNYPDCSLKEVVAGYGRPNASVLISGSLAHPKELLLFYDYGINKSEPKTDQPAAGPATVLPISLDQLTGTTCAVPTSMNIVAHEDDDLLFMNPDIIHDINDGRCVRTIYVTAGDDGAGEFYWLSREQGSEAAYSRMAGVSPIWIQKIVQLPNNQYVTIANPKGDQKISLIFMHLPDGNINGSGFESSSNESLLKLESRQISVIQTVDHQSSYTSTQLANALVSLMYAYQPSDIRTQASFIGKQFADHTDHITVGHYAKDAYTQYEESQYDNQVTIPLKFYIGYPIHGMPENVTGNDLQAKSAAFLAYAKFDDKVCQTMEQCETASVYGIYLHRQYQDN